ncbi:hypothetical protein DFH11DRAFT_1510063 [Phellopilus nigrolimitatus]|nr:hypothetical protein DFH11DRAFT_1510063 [Phellopilus nigrolimitatus]
MTVSSRPTASNTLYDNLNKVYAQAEASLSESSISTNATADNLPGPGRTLGNIFMFLGRRLEAAANRFMEKRGYGPEASRKRLEKLNWGEPLDDTVQNRKLLKEAEKLLKYVRSQYESNQMLALDAILDFATHDQIRQMFIELNAARVVGLALRQAEVENCDQLLSRSRKALICLVETDIHTLGKKLMEASQKRTSIAVFTVFSDLMRVREMIYALQEAITMDLSFLGLRYVQETAEIIFRKDKRANIRITVFEFLLSILEYEPSAIEWPVFASALYCARTQSFLHWKMGNIGSHEFWLPEAYQDHEHKLQESYLARSDGRLFKTLLYVSPYAVCARPPDSPLY